MTLSELIEKLQSFKKDHGDIDVTAYDDNGEHQEVTELKLGGTEYHLAVGNFHRQMKHVNIS